MLIDPLKICNWRTRYVGLCTFDIWCEKSGQQPVKVQDYPCAHTRRDRAFFSLNNSSLERIWGQRKEFPSRKRTLAPKD